ncbi:MAG: amidase family protein, partial [Actinomycetes bacterium]
MTRNLVDLSALEVSAMVHTRKVTCVEIMQVHLQRVVDLEPVFHTLVTRKSDEDLLREATDMDAELDAGGWQGWLHGLPYAVKDLVDAAGLPTTLGFRAPVDTPPADSDEAFVRRVRRAGAIVVGKTNTSEFGLGSHSYNQVAPTTVNVADPTRSAGGSSGGAAVAVASGLVPVADGSDFMGSLRNPPGWNGVLGMRPSPGVVLDRGDDPKSPGFAVEGPIARTTADLAALLRTMAEPGAEVGVAERADSDEPRVAWLGDVCGAMPFEAGILDVCRSASERWSPSLQDRVIPLGEGFAGPGSLWPTWLTIRHDSVGGWLAAEFSQDEIACMKPEAQWEIDGYRRLTDVDRERAALAVTALRRATSRLFEDVDLVFLPTAQTWPFPAEQAWPSSISGTTMSTYHRWMEVTTFATLAGLPTLAVPAGRDATGHHIGLQVIGRPGADSELLGWLAWAERRQCFSVEAP